jgi:DNA-binding MarR family transcriptional regulator
MTRKEIFAKILQNIGVLHRFGAGHKAMHSPDKMPTRSQLCIMVVLAQDGSKSIKELAEQFSMSSSAATQIVDGLVKEKVLMRQVDKNDRRKISISLTVTGKKKLLQAKKLRAKAMAKYFDPLNDKELAQLQKLLEKIVEHFNYEKN